MNQTFDEMASYCSGLADMAKIFGVKIEYVNDGVFDAIEDGALKVSYKQWHYIRYISLSDMELLQTVFPADRHTIILNLVRDALDYLCKTYYIPELHIADRC